ncbi:MAG: Xaa-Pro peptidase family protein [Christensenellaceae bacterium]|jgi:Xaa-Pro aminopeptidase|nr:Xaa-Pro peptidase family protein [Christensenellaceae bacterium]
MDKVFFRNSDVAIINSKSNLFYFSGLDNEDAAIVLTSDKKFYITDPRNIETARDTVKDFEFVVTNSKNYLLDAASLCKNLNKTKIGFEDVTIKHIDYTILQDALKEQDLIPMSHRISEIRSVKSESEIACIVKAQEITDKVYSEIIEYIKPGMTEIQVASQLNSKIYAYGGSLAFDSIVSFGRNTSKPHSTPGDNVLNKIDVVLLDFGAKYKGYCSDMSRSFAVGRIDPQYKKTYETVIGAQNAVLSRLSVNMTGGECDEIGRGYFKNFNVDKHFTHSLGHGVGIDIHEVPSLSTKSQDVMLPGTVVTIEPGLYYEGTFGVRIEDMVRFENNGVYNLTKSDKSLIII